MNRRTRRVIVHVPADAAASAERQPTWVCLIVGLCFGIALVLPRLLAGTDDGIPQPIADERPCLKPSRPLREIAFGGFAELSISPRTVVAGNEVEVQLVFTCQTGWWELLNPFLLPSENSPSQIAVFGENGTYVGDLLRHRGSSATTKKATWLLVRSGDTVGTQVRIPTRSGVRKPTGVAVENVRNSGTSTTLVLLPGKYFLQAIYTGRFLAVRSRNAERRDGDKPAEVAEKASDEELFRSNVVTVEVCEAGQVKEATTEE